MSENLVEKAKKFAIIAHSGQKRKNGEPYIIHPQAVAEAVQKKMEDEGIWGPIQIKWAVAAAWLHDVVEDTPVTIEDIEERFPNAVSNYVENLTRRKEENYFEFIRRVDFYVAPRLIKILDIIHNMSDLEEGTLKDKYRFALHFLQGRSSS